MKNSNVCIKTHNNKLADNKLLKRADLIILSLGVKSVSLFGDNER